MKDRIRTIIQLAAAVILNGYAVGFSGGRVFNGATKAFCVPVLNCYACPGALGSCPIGSLQHVLGGNRHKISFYVLGLLMLFGVALGRLWCGFVCPFGFVQDLIGRVPVRRVDIPRRVDKPLRCIKYIVLAVMVILLPLIAKKPYGIADSFFCKYLCPAGTLQGGIPLLIGNKALRPLVGFLFSWKMLVLILILIAAMFIPRFFCRYLCPLGAFYGLFNRFSFFQMSLDRIRCTGCKSCERACPMAVKLPTEGEGIARITCTECIRCGRCKTACPTGAICSGFGRSPELETGAVITDDQA